MARELFFSFIVPAHNEERYLGKTLEHLASLAYPASLYEVVVVENGSSDTTYSIARAHEQGNVRVYTYATSGVSFARNRGLEKIREHADWVIFLDADTLVEPCFLSDLSARINKHSSVSCGTTRVCPIRGTAVARLWYRIYDGVHAVFGNSWALFFVRADIAHAISFNEKAALMEDQQYLAAARTKGKFLYVDTPSVSTSTRRFDKDGWLRPILLYAYVGLLPAKVQEFFSYGVVR